LLFLSTVCDLPATWIEAVWIRGVLLDEAAGPVPVEAVPPQAARASAAEPRTMAPGIRIASMATSSARTFAPEIDIGAGYVRPLPSRRARCTIPSTMSRRLRFAYFYAYLGPARVRLGMS
jgi:hypothetical protein